jgi:hypothetical protein
MGSIILDGTAYDPKRTSAKKFKSADGTTPIVDAATQAAATTTPKTPLVTKAKAVKYLVWGVGILAIYLLWKKYAKK